VAADVIMKAEVAGADRRVNGRAIGGAEVLFADQPVNRTGGDFAQKFTARVRPLIQRAAADEDRVGCVQGNDHVRVHRHVVPVPGVFLKIARELPRKIRRHVVNGFAVIATRERGTHFAGATGVNERKPRIARARDEDRFAETRVADERNVFGVHQPVLLQIIQLAAGAPGPRADSAPSVRRRFGLAGRKRQSDDAGMECVRIVRLNVGVAEGGVAVAVRENICDGAGFAEARSAGGSC
jgi:hypothetical protein